MKIADTFVIEIEGATFEFQHPEYDDLQAMQEEQKAVDRISYIFSKLLNVKGLEDSSGPVDKDRVKTLKMPAYVVNKIIKGYSDKVAETLGLNKDADPKKPNSGTAQ